jgi:hypothetical protein
MSFNSLFSQVAEDSNNRLGLKEVTQNLNIATERPEQSKSDVVANPSAISDLFSALSALQSNSSAIESINKLNDSAENGANNLNANIQHGENSYKLKYEYKKPIVKSTLENIFSGRAAQFKFEPELMLKYIVSDLNWMGKIVKNDPTNYELETRLILIVDGSNQILTDLPRKFWSDLCTDHMRNKAKEFPTQTICEVYDKYYDNNTRHRKTQIINVSDKVQKPPRIEWHFKDLIKNSDWFIDGRDFGLRVSLKVDKVLKSQPEWIKSGEDGQPATTPIRFVCKRTTTFKGNFVTIFFSTVWEGETEAACKLAKPTQVIEVEVNNEDIISNPDMTSEQIITNLIIRTLELQGIEESFALRRRRS